MNILLVCRDFLSWGGSTSRWSGMVDYLQKKYRVFVVANVPKKFALKHFKQKRVYILQSPLKRTLTIIPFMNLINIALMFSYLSRLLSKMNLDLVVVTVPEIEEGIASAIASKMYRKNLVFDVRDLIVEDYVESVYMMFPKPFRKFFKFFLTKLLVYAYNSSDCVVTVTSLLRDYLLSDGVKVPVRVIPNGADTTLFQSVGTERKLEIRKSMGFGNNFLLLYAGAMDVDYYPVDVILCAFEMITKSVPDVKLVLCGSRSGRIEKLITRLGKNVYNLGLLKHVEVAEVMQASDIGFISMDERRSTFCALTTKLFEYLASGLPVVAACPRGGELDRLITRERVGHAVSCRDYRSMAEKTIRLLGNDQRRRICAQNGMKLVTTRFNRRKLAELYDKILFETAKSRR